MFRADGRQLEGPLILRQRRKKLLRSFPDGPRRKLDVPSADLSGGMLARIEPADAVGRLHLRGKWPGPQSGHLHEVGVEEHHVGGLPLGRVVRVGFGAATQRDFPQSLADYGPVGYDGSQGLVDHIDLPLDVVT